MNREEIAARLVLADHRYQCPLYEIVTLVEAIVREAVEDERKACEKLCNEEHLSNKLSGDYRYGAGVCAMKIGARVDSKK